MTAPLPVVALLMTLSGGYLRDVYRGIFGYLRMHGRPFRVTMVNDLKFIRTMTQPAAGVIALATEAELARRLAALGLPVVNVSGRLDPSGLPTVRVDDHAIGELAADYFLANGLRHFAYFGHKGAAIFSRRGDGFIRRLGQAHACSRLDVSIRVPTLELRAADRQRLRRWLRMLPKPVGLLCGTDWVAGALYEACEELGLRVGVDLAVLGVDNDEFLCETQDPPLSSVDTHPNRVGYEAAAIMAGMLRGQPAPLSPVLIPPVGVVQRQSSDLLAVPDPQVAAVLRHIRDHACEPLSVARLVPLVSLSRRVLERRFRACMGYSMLTEIHRMKLERIRERLGHTEQTLEQIAAACGFAQVSHMSALFRKKTGQAPGAFRALMRRGRPKNSE
jgi:LacI family transcriptional regulator